MKFTDVYDAMFLYNTIVGLQNGLSGGWGNSPECNQIDRDTEKILTDILKYLLTEGIKVEFKPDDTIVRIYVA